MSERTAEILKRMSTREKIGQLNQVPLVDVEEAKNKARKGEIGSVILAHTAFAGLEETERACMDDINEIQQAAIEGNGIPVIVGRDVIHGYGEVFPIPLAMAASFNMHLVKEGYAMLAEAASADGIHWTFAPMLDVSRDPRWGRIIESPGEDPYLGECIAKAAVEGLQGDNLADEKHIAACAKHYIGYGASEGGRDYYSTEISEYTLRNVYLRAFKAAVDSGVCTVMSSFNEISGQPVTSNQYLLKDVLKKELGFDGFVVSDWESVEQLINQGTADNRKECAYQAFSAGVDMDMTDECYSENLEELVLEGRISMGQLDESVMRILDIKEKLGLLDNPYTKPRKVDTEKFRNIAYKTALESMVLLKNNNNVLPLSKESKIALFGYMADEKRALLGSWVPDFTLDDVHSIRETFEDIFADVYGGSYFLPEEVYRHGRNADALILVIGETHFVSGEARSLTSIELTAEQKELAKRARKCGKPVIGILVCGRPIALGDTEELFDALICAWQSGTMTAEAVAALLTGKECPSGKTPVSFPRATGQVPIYYNTHPAARVCNLYYDEPYEIYNYEDCQGTPMYPFGFGLSYTEFMYDTPQINTMQLSYDEIKSGKKFLAELYITNIGKYTGSEVAQCYIRDRCASMTRPIRELRGFVKEKLKPGETKRIVFELGFDELGFYNRNGDFDVERGEFEIYIGRNCIDTYCLKIRVY